MNLILLTEHDRKSEATFELRDYRAVHIATILRAQSGDFLEVGLVDGPIGRAEVQSVSAESVMLHCETWKEADAPQPAIDLVCALPRPQTVKKILFTAGMCAVRSVSFIRANRVEKSFYHSPLLTDSAMRPYMLEGMSQGKQTRVPMVSIHDRFRPFIEETLPTLLDHSSECLKIIPSPESKDNLADAFAKQSSQLLSAIGPEGGWVDFELEQFAAAGFQPITLGRWVLRVEHAVTALLGQVELLRHQSKEQNG